jgi:hypothetical protein
MRTAVDKPGEHVTGMWISISAVDLPEILKVRAESLLSPFLLGWKQLKGLRI